MSFRLTPIEGARPLVRAHIPQLANELVPADHPRRGQLVDDAQRVGELVVLPDTYHNMIPISESIARGEPWAQRGQFLQVAAATLDVLRYKRDVLKLAAAIADAVVSHSESEATRFGEQIMPAKTDPAGPAHGDTLAADKLNDAGYDSANDPQLKAEESDVAALKAGHTTKAQAEALLKSDLAEQNNSGEVPPEQIAVATEPAKAAEPKADLPLSSPPKGKK